MSSPVPALGKPGARHPEARLCARHLVAPNPSRPHPARITLAEAPWVVLPGCRDLRRPQVTPDVGVHYSRVRAIVFVSAYPSSVQGSNRAVADRRHVRRLGGTLCAPASTWMNRLGSTRRPVRTRTCSRSKLG